MTVEKRRCSECTEAGHGWVLSCLAGPGEETFPLSLPSFLGCIFSLKNHYGGVYYNGHLLQFLP